MMKKYIYLLLYLFFCSVCTLPAESKMDLQLLKTITSLRAKAKSLGIKSMESQSITVLAILNKDSVLPYEEFDSLGICIGTRVGRVVTLQVPLGSLQELSEHPSIEQLNANRRHHVTCLNTRKECGAVILHDEATALANGIGSSYTGKGVLMGIVDTGIQYNHINFRNPSTQESRLLGAVLYRPEEGMVDSIREYYTEPAQLDTLTTDNIYNAHGTHTSGIAGGSYLDLDMQGMAPEADLMLCGTSVLDDDRIIDALQTTFARAEELGEPCVINLSIGNPVDWKDGRSALCLACEELTDGGNAPGRAIVFSAGNDGGKNFTIDYQFTDTLPVYSLLQPAVIGGETRYINPNIDAYCTDSLPVQLDFVLYDTLTNTFDEMPFEQHLLDTLEAGHDGRRHLCIDADTCDMRNLPDKLLAARLRGSVGSRITLYYINDNSISYAMSDHNLGSRWLCGSPAHSISDLCCTDAVISVGAYSAVDSLTNVFGRTVYPWSPRGEVCSFSSYGPSGDGTSKPDVIAPGASVVSSFSSYWEDKIVYYYTSGRYPDSPMMYVVSPEGEDQTYYWIHSVGTSQSSPVVAGIIALWMEACPTLSVRDIRSILQKTSRFDDYCHMAPGGPIQSGFGKVDAVAGMKEVWAMMGIEMVHNDSAKSLDCFNMHGQRLVSKDAGKGLYIINGKKIFRR
ncbi:MAG: S8 family serine peptidase [Bacteroidales bacterium]|nr:S8 family serine peptidase [Bacteroidales bacterium]